MMKKFKEGENWLSKSRYIQCLSGILDVEERKLIHHNPEYEIKTTIPCNFDPYASYERWNKFLEEVFPGESEKAEMLQEFFGYCLLPEFPFKKMLVLWGGGFGKSTVLNVLREMVGRNNFSCLTMNDLKQQHLISLLEGKLVNMANEANIWYPANTKILGTMIKGAQVRAKMKYDKSYTFRPFAKFVVEVGQSPILPGRDYSFGDMVLAVEYKRAFTEKEVDPYLLEKLMEERDGVFLWSLFGLERLLQNGRFSVPEVVKVESAKFMKILNHTPIFVAKRCMLDRNKKVGTSTLYDEYKSCCFREGYYPVSQRKFCAEILSDYPSVSKCVIDLTNTRQRGFVGIGLKSALE